MKIFFLLWCSIMYCFKCQYLVSILVATDLKKTVQEECGNIRHLYIKPIKIASIKCERSLVFLFWYRPFKMTTLIIFLTMETLPFTSVKQILRKKDYFIIFFFYLSLHELIGSCLDFNLIPLVLRKHKLLMPSIADFDFSFLFLEILNPSIMASIIRCYLG